jgi:16S rRNA (adenine1518-N6/adenine1519-N6)-dimethyltransferase
MHRMKKSLGQHFLRDEEICRKIMAVLENRPLQRLLEVGPGGGALTKYIMKIPDLDFRAVETDGALADKLEKEFPALRGKIIRGDVLAIEKPFGEIFGVLGNFPYNISTQILFRILDWREDIGFVIGMFQKEVAQRIAAHDGNKVYGILSVLVQAFFTVEYLFEVSEDCFMPPPRVKSAVILLEPRPEALPMKDPSALFQLVKMSFNQRRKTLRNAAKPLFTEQTLREPVFDKRAEQLSVKDFAHLTFQMR